MPFARHYWMLRIIAVFLEPLDKQPSRLEKRQTLISTGAGTLLCTLFVQDRIAATVPGAIKSKELGLAVRGRKGVR